MRPQGGRSAPYRPAPAPLRPFTFHHSWRVRRPPGALHHGQRTSKRDCAPGVAPKGINSVHQMESGIGPVYVETVHDFIARVTEDALTNRDRLDSNVSSGTLYRGQANSSWHLCPSLYRDGLFYKEQALIAELRRVRPEEFNGLSRFDILVKMQHYGLPTRLLDMTHNPLVALFFACEAIGFSEAEGSVYALQNMPVLWQDNYAVHLIMSYVFDYGGPQLDLGRFVEAALNDPVISAFWNDASKLRETATHYLTKVPIIAVRPSLANLRVAQQDGAFLLFGMNLKNVEVSTNPGTKGRVYLELAPYLNNEPGGQLWHKITEYRVPADRKSRMLRALEALGITRSRLFPELQHQAEFVRNFVAREAATERGAIR